MAEPLRIDKKNFIPAHTNSFPCEKDGMKGKVSTFACSMHKLIEFIKENCLFVRDARHYSAHSVTLRHPVYSTFKKLFDVMIFRQF